ncbi:FAD-dependent oxidoreductase [uncultured Aquimarina sp.]|uniref:FAD-dependent oxidoreductase n=1 Tax=uncultured Aquimarina sp. TaxID=575652 RepID=UPI00262E2F4E|nr:FAD-dependent oxidoreductase [uncultured Aquimarina sp.]
MTDPRFPVLTQKQINILKTYGTVDYFDEQTLIFKIGDLSYDFFVILKGEVIVVDESNKRNLIVTHGINEFTGDNSMLSSKTAQFNAYASKDSTLLRIKPDSLKELISKQSDIGDVLLTAFIHRQETMLKEFDGGIKIIGTEKSKESYDLRDFLDKNHIWYTYLNTEQSPEAIQLLENFNLSINDLPIVLGASGELLKQPSIEELAKHTGVLLDFGDELYDVLVVGAGPSGLAASVYAASEGLSVVTIDSKAPGGQAGKSSKIENYLGFPTGISGSDLANKAFIQAQKFGCYISIPHKAKKVIYNGKYFTLLASNDMKIKAKTVIAATGANYKHLPISNIKKFEGCGIFYSATGMNAAACNNEIVGVVGGGNSAGQAVLFIAEFAKEAHIIIRGNDLGAKMSDYLVQRIKATPNIKIHKGSNVVKLNGDNHLESLVLDTKNKLETIPISNLFTFIGAKPCSEWLNGIVSTDEKGFIYTGPDVKIDETMDSSIYKYRKPQSLETSIPGFFAVGDVRKGSVKRVASAVGEGSMAISQIHQYLTEINQFDL